MRFAMGQRNDGGLTIKDVIELNQALKDKAPNVDLMKLRSNCQDTAARSIT